MSGIRIVQLFGDLLGTYGDNGNTLVLAKRAKWRNTNVDVTKVRSGETIPDDGDLYVIGGGEDGPQNEAKRQLATSGALQRGVDKGAAVLAVCAGFQILGHTYCGPDGEPIDGLGLIDAHSTRTTGERLVGDVVADSHPDLSLGQLTGYENHAGVTTLGTNAQPLGQVVAGTGNGPGRGVEGAWQGRIIGTYLHGPVLARNPSLADLLLAWALDVAPGSLAPLDDTRIDALRSERFRAAAQVNSSKRTEKRRFF